MLSCYVGDQSARYAEALTGAGIVKLCGISRRGAITKNPRHKWAKAILPGRPPTLPVRSAAAPKDGKPDGNGRPKHRAILDAKSSAFARTEKMKQEVILKRTNKVSSARCWVCAVICPPAETVISGRSQKPKAGRDF